LSATISQVDNTRICDARVGWSANEMFQQVTFNRRANVEAITGRVGGQ
jgi:hypothetical protein